MAPPFGQLLRLAWGSLLTVFSHSHTQFTNNSMSSPNPACQTQASPSLHIWHLNWDPCLSAMNLFTDCSASTLSHHDPRPHLKGCSPPRSQRDALKSNSAQVTPHSWSFSGTSLNSDLNLDSAASAMHNLGLGYFSTSLPVSLTAESPWTHQARPTSGPLSRLFPLPGMPFP